MSNTINDQTWDMINQLTQQQNGAKRGEARLAELHHVRGKAAHAKDVVLPAAGDKTPAGKKGKGMGEKPFLPVPTSKFMGLQGDDDLPMSLISLIGLVMALQAKSNSNFWKTLWNQASQSMLIEVKCAPVIADAIKNQYKAQSDSTKQQADQKEFDGWVNIACAGGAIALGGFQGFQAGQEVADLADSGSGFEEVDGGADDAAALPSDGAGASATPTATAEEDVSALKSVDEGDNASKAKGLAKAVKNKMSFANAKTLAETLGKISMMSGLTQGLSAGITGLGDPKYLNKIANLQGTEGQQAALSKEMEQYAQFYGQSFGRSEDLRQGSQQLIDYCNNILKSSADSLTQTVNSMFRG